MTKTIFVREKTNLNSFRQRHKRKKHLCRSCLYLYGSQPKLENLKIKSFEQEICNMSHVNQYRKFIFDDSFMITGP